MQPCGQKYPAASRSTAYRHPHPSARKSDGSQNTPPSGGSRHIKRYTWSAWRFPGRQPLNISWLSPVSPNSPVNSFSHTLPARSPECRAVYGETRNPYLWFYSRVCKKIKYFRKNYDVFLAQSTWEIRSSKLLAQTKGIFLPHFLIENFSTNLRNKRNWHLFLEYAPIITNFKLAHFLQLPQKSIQQLKPYSLKAVSLLTRKDWKNFWTQRYIYTQHWLKSHFLKIKAIRINSKCRILKHY